MSKAFTREDDLPDQTVVPRPSVALPPGAKNYITPDGARRLRSELAQLIDIEKPKAQKQSGQEDESGRLKALDERIHRLKQILESAVVVEASSGAAERVRFGATVVVRERSGAESRYRIVGIDKTDIDRGWVSWLSPIARALLNAQKGQTVKLKLPAGEEELEVAEIIYETEG